jgi:dephospho-CoA kinase
MESLTFPLSEEGVQAIRWRLRGTETLLLGLTGGIATGKSTVSLMLEEMGAPLIDFDVLSRRVVMPGTAALKKIVGFFGKEFITADGTLDRKRLAQIVFKDESKRKQLESFTHPDIFQAFFHEIDRLVEIDPASIIQVSIPLLIELGLQPIFDRVVLVYAGPLQQTQRLIERDGISRREADDILKSQMPIDAKLACADYVIGNEGSLADTRKQVESIWRDLIACRSKTVPGA